MKKFIFVSICLLIIPLESIHSQIFSGASSSSISNGFNLIEFSIRGIIDFVTIFFLGWVIYYIRHRDADFLFTLVLFNVANFLICFLLSDSNLHIGLAFGLFAMFSILRFRTQTVPVKEMGFLFLAAALGLFNSMAPDQNSYLVMIGSNVFLLILAFGLDRFSSHYTEKNILYENLELIKPEFKQDLILDIHNRTGLAVRDVDIIRIDLKKKIAELKIKY